METVGHMAEDGEWWRSFFGSLSVSDFRLVVCLRLGRRFVRWRIFSVFLELSVGLSSPEVCYSRNGASASVTDGAWHG